MTRKEEENQLLKRAQDFLKTAEYQKREGVYDLATFSLEQALQLHLKAKLLSEGIDYPRTHSLRRLLEMLMRTVPDNKKTIIGNILENCTLELGMLEDAYITSRYVMREFTKKEAEKLTSAVKETMKNIG